MCHLCWQPATPILVSRRHFLQYGVTATAMALLSACGRHSTPSGEFAHQIPISTSSTDYPDLAASIGRYESGVLTVALPQGTIDLVLPATAVLRDLNGQPTKQIDWSAAMGQTVLIWQNDAQTEVSAVQQLPSIGVTDDIPTLSQPVGTGETRPFGPFSLITRGGWGAAETTWVPSGESGLYDPVSNRGGWLVYDDPLAETLHSVVIHHTALEFGDGPQAVQALHMQTANFADVGYHFLIDGAGQLYEGRPFNVRGAHTGGFNTGYVGVCLLGNFEAAPPIQAQLNTLRRLLAHLRETYTITHMGGHRDFQPGVTVCPGQNLHPLLPQLAMQLGYTYQAV